MFGLSGVRYLLIGLLGLGLILPAAAQSEGEADASSNPYGSVFGGEILLTNSGFGLGGYVQRALSSSMAFVAEMSLGAGKDEREVAFFDRFGRKDVPNKANYLLMVPAQIGLHKRLFQEDIEDNFRPYLQLTTGPTVGWVYPYFDDENGNGTLDDEERSFDAIGGLPRGHFELGLGGTIALGAHFGFSQKVTQGVRLGYTFTYFFDGVQLLEPQVQRAQHFFGTPTITVLFGKLF